MPWRDEQRPKTGWRHNSPQHKKHPWRRARVAPVGLQATLHTGGDVHARCVTHSAPRWNGEPRSHAHYINGRTNPEQLSANMCLRALGKGETVIPMRANETRGVARGRDVDRDVANGWSKLAANEWVQPHPRIVRNTVALATGWRPQRSHADRERRLCRMRRHPQPLS